MTNISVLKQPLWVDEVAMSEPKGPSVIDYSLVYS